MPDLPTSGILSRVNLRIGEVPVEVSEDTILARFDCNNEPPTRSALKTDPEALVYKL